MPTHNTLIALPASSNPSKKITDLASIPSYQTLLLPSIGLKRNVASDKFRQPICVALRPPRNRCPRLSNCAGFCRGYKRDRDDRPTTSDKSLPHPNCCRTMLSATQIL